VRCLKQVGRGPQCQAENAKCEQVLAQLLHVHTETSLDLRSERQSVGNWGIKIAVGVPRLQKSLQSCLMQYLVGHRFVGSLGREHGCCLAAHK
jgi:hypothetical protein